MASATTLPSGHPPGETGHSILSASLWLLPPKPSSTTKYKNGQEIHNSGEHAVFQVWFICM